MDARALLVGLLICPSAWADRGALTVEAGGGGAGALVPAPYVSSPKWTPSLAPTAVLGLRYAWSNRLELTLGGYFEAPVTDFHNGVVVTTENGAFAGTLRHQVMGWGAVAGARAVFGMVWRLVVGFETGWSHRDYFAFSHIDDSDPGAPTDYGLKLAAFGADDWILSPTAGIEWCAGDHWAVSLVPKLRVLVGPQATVELVVPLTVSWSWYL